MSLLFPRHAQVLICGQSENSKWEGLCVMEQEGVCLPVIGWGWGWQICQKTAHQNRWSTGGLEKFNCVEDMSLLCHAEPQSSCMYNSETRKLRFYFILAATPRLWLSPMMQNTSLFSLSLLILDPLFLPAPSCNPPQFLSSLAHNGFFLWR